MSVVKECYESSPSSHHPLDWPPYQLLQTQCFGCPVIYGCDRTHAQMGRHNDSMEYAEECCCTPTSQMHWKKKTDCNQQIQTVSGPWVHFKLTKFRFRVQDLGFMTHSYTCIHLTQEMSQGPIDCITLSSMGSIKKFKKKKTKKGCLTPTQVGWLSYKYGNI